MKGELVSTQFRYRFQPRYFQQPSLNGTDSWAPTAFQRQPAFSPCATGHPLFPRLVCRPGSRRIAGYVTGITLGIVRFLLRDLPDLQPAPEHGRPRTFGYEQYVELGRAVPNSLRTATTRDLMGVAKKNLLCTFVDGWTCKERLFRGLGGPGPENVLPSTKGNKRYTLFALLFGAAANNP